MTSDPKVDFLPAKHPIQRINPEIRGRLVGAQQSIFQRAFPDALAFVERVVQDLKLAIALPAGLKDEPASKIGDMTFPEVISFYEPLLKKSGISGTALNLHSINLAQRTQLVRAFDDPDRAVARVTEKVTTIVADFPRTAADIERGRNPGDVLDPYILAAAQTLLYKSDFKGAIEATVAHKALMIIEGLMGHLHEDVIGEMRGNIRAPEPRGTNQEILDPFTNPFPGADVVQPPTAPGERLRVHQVKSKTGSAKGGDGKRLGEQLRQLGQYYDADMFYDAIIGSTLRGHRSMNAVITAAPKAVVLVGAATFRELTRCQTGPALLLRVYQNAFSEAARSTGYFIDDMATGIVDTFRARSEQAGEGYLELLLRDATGGEPSEQDSRHYVVRRRTLAGG